MLCADGCQGTLIYAATGLSIAMIDLKLSIVDSFLAWLFALVIVQHCMILFLVCQLPPCINSTFFLSDDGLVICDKCRKQVGYWQPDEEE